MVGSGGQLILAGTQKIAGLATYQEQLGSKPLANAIIVLDLTLGTLILVGGYLGTMVWLIAASFFAIGSVYKACLLYTSRCV